MDIKKIISTNKSLAIISATALILVLLGIILIPKLFGKNEPDFAVVAKSSLNEIKEISELSTIEYNYNSIATVTTEKGKEQYHVKYKGVAKAGIDFENITITDVKKEHKLLVTLPPVEIREPSVDPESLEFIFVKDKYETETVFMEALDFVKSDLAVKVAEDNTLNELAYENAKTIVEALLEPWLEQLSPDYTLEIA
ncbi:MAG: DUF4230 domain-containing protein [Clostridia bacterium]|nr:DUF4230 domain-containing protein [Clostridia bacterium]MBR5266017.1 DUF4230 domain-containing protein [Clostridia bacterium]